VWNTFANFEKLPMVNCHPKGDNSPNLVALITSASERKSEKNFSSKQELIRTGDVHK
jgi:hypothetical protein